MDVITPTMRLRHPTPRHQGVPVLGVLPELGKNPLLFFVNAARQSKGIVLLEMGPRRMYLVSHPEYVKYILQDNNKNYVKGYDLAKPLLGEGLVTSEGDFWRRQRRIMQPVFSKAQVQALTTTMISCTSDMLTRWAELAEANREIDAAVEMMNLTQTIIVKTMFSTEVSAESKEISTAFATTLEYLNTLLLSPFAFVDKLPTPTNRRFHRALDTINTVIYRIIAERRDHPEDQKDLLSVLLSARDEETGEGMSDLQIHDEVMTIFLAGHETTATLLAWTWYLLARDPVAGRRVREEVQQMVGDRLPGAEDLPKMPYGRMVLDEALRMYPPAWMFARQTIAEDEIGGFRIPAGAMTMLSPYVTQHLPEFWENPEGFDPERFDPERVEKRPRYAYFPFGGGPRQCIGNHFALTEAQLILSMVIQRFQLELLPGVNVVPRSMATLRPSPGVPVLLRPL